MQFQESRIKLILLMQRSKIEEASDPEDRYKVQYDVLMNWAHRKAVDAKDKKGGN